jgi:hypothetical protein
VGIGVVPETDWHSGADALQLGTGASIYGDTTPTGNQISANARATVGSALNGYKYIATDKASTYQQYDGVHNFRVAASGSADAAITWTTGFEVLNDGKARAKNGLLFGTDTAATNTLDDYEEGTWAPVLAGGAGTITSQTNAGQYTKVGNMVTITGHVNITNWGNASGGVILSNFPFSTAQKLNLVGVETNINGKILSGRKNTTGQSSCDVYYYDNSGPANGGVNNWNMIFSAVYRTAQ